MKEYTFHGIIEFTVPIDAESFEEAQEKFEELSENDLTDPEGGEFGDWTTPPEVEAIFEDGKQVWGEAIHEIQSGT